LKALKLTGNMVKIKNAEFDRGLEYGCNLQSMPGKI
jgi:hypothetical protein